VTDTEVVVHPDTTELVAAASSRLMSRIVDAQAAHGGASVVLTGGGVGIGLLRALRESPSRDTIDWARLDLWWGDERFLPAGDPERNETQAREALLDHVPVDPARVHPMPASDGPDGDDPEAAAERYAAELAAASPGQRLPRFDVFLLGVGEEGHVASIFPESPAAREEVRLVVAVRGCPKPPPVRISLTFPAISGADEVWLAAAGAAKAPVIGMALSGADPIQVPAAGVRGDQRTLWLLDREAATAAP